MSTLKDTLSKNEFIAPHKDMTDVHFVIKITLHDIFLRRESDDEVFGISKNEYNRGLWHKVDPKTVEVLYAEMLDSVTDDNSDASE